MILQLYYNLKKFIIYLDVNINLFKRFNIYEVNCYDKKKKQIHVSKN
ncbi:hypothetical protein CNEO4_970025 [Clostridium neonatale]|nr:hypothetical protein CNEO2_80033 [Clostridium neonatale]CAI3540127.1 hypothetical protein CNEO3_10101 [Clostridium neonatale]CAI3556444.1 hypothetical protein CNEO4_1050025 [Clostridium neonatale]CAI3611001.1 hypothetical protein CNEO4_40062 [Clostridium neonatale]CAI3710691.1 hypothetical protein CNEO2_690032 [Clostridium neonatale]